jgi:hypothetical protein
MGFLDLIYKSCTIILIGKIINDLNKNENREFLKEKGINLIFELLYIYSKCEIYYNLHFKSYLLKIYDIFKHLLCKNTPIYSSIEFYLNGVLINKDNIKDNNVELIKEEYENINFDLIIYTDYNTIKTPNKVCFYEFPKKLIYEISNIKFISLTLYYNEETINIDILNKKYNYYIVNNKIDKKFIFYYLYYICKYYKISKFEDFSYQLVLIDSNVNMHKLNEHEEIIIDKNSYYVFNTKTTTLLISNLEKKTNEINNNDFILT